MRHFLSLLDRTPAELVALLDRADTMKRDPAPWRHALADRALAMIFQKPSTRTRVSFELGMTQLGGTALFLAANDLQLGRGETVADTARVLGRYADGIMARVFDHGDLVALTAGGVPVINGLSDLLHPCQALADVMTIRERRGDLAATTVAYLGDGDNVCHSLINAAAQFGFALRVATPAVFDPRPEIVAAARAAGGRIETTHDPKAAVAGADVVYTDVWASMGHEAEIARRRRVFARYRVDEAKFALAAPDAIFMHCLPAHRGEEVVDAVLDHPRSVVLDQAENRLHAQKAVLVELMAGADAMTR